jgi:hypothetical protein
MTKKQLVERIAWLEHLVEMASKAADRWKIEKNKLLEQWEDAVKEIKFWKNKCMSLQSENRSLRAENLLLKENLKEVLKLMEKYDRRINSHNLLRPISNASQKPFIKRSISKTIDSTPDKENVSESILEPDFVETKVETNFDIRIKDLKECLKRKLDLKA